MVTTVLAKSFVIFILYRMLGGLLDLSFNSQKFSLGYA